MFTDSTRLETAETENRLRELEILNAPIKELSKIRASELTGAQVIALADIVNAVHDLTSIEVPPSGQDVTDYFAPPSAAERRGGSVPDAASAYDDLSDEERAELASRLRSLFSDMIPNDSPIKTVNGPIRYADIPKDADGNVPSAWIDENCTCDEHERKRIERDRVEVSGPGGMYL